MKRTLGSMPEFRTKVFKVLFFPSTITKWDKLDSDMRNSEKTIISKNNIFKEIAFLTAIIWKE